MQKPHGPKDQYCPHWRKQMSRVCHMCPLWVQVRGKNPNTGADVDRWDCAQAWAPMLAIETTQQVRQAGAAIESARNEAVKSAEKIEAATVRAAAAIARAVYERPTTTLIEGDHGKAQQAITHQS